jgi:hypothetical protein
MKKFVLRYIDYQDFLAPDPAHIVRKRGLCVEHVFEAKAIPEAREFYQSLRKKKALTQVRIDHKTGSVLVKECSARVTPTVAKKMRFAVRAKRLGSTVRQVRLEA